MKHPRSSLVVPALVGVYSIAGLYLGRALRNSSANVSLGQVLLLGGTSAAAAAVAPMISHRLMCPWSPTTPLVNAGISSALVWGAMRAEGFMEDSAALFVPVQIGSSLLAEVVAHELLKMKHEKKATS